MVKNKRKNFRSKAEKRKYAVDERMQSARRKETARSNRKNVREESFSNP